MTEKEKELSAKIEAYELALAVIMNADALDAAKFKIRFAALEEHAARNSSHPAILEVLKSISDRFELISAS